MDQINKFLRLLTKKEQQAMMLILQQLLINYKKIPGVIALKGKKNWYRVRLGMYRIIFTVHANNSVHIKRITKRNENTYKNL